MKVKFMLVLAAVISLFSCGQEKNQKTDIMSYMPDTLSESGIARTSEIDLYRGDSLWEYIDGGAELYHSYNFVEVATAEYDRDSIQFITDIYEFDTPLDAFGLYSALRPPEMTPIYLGVEGYMASASISYVKGQYLVRLTAFEESEAVNTVLADMAKALDIRLPGVVTYPVEFSQFPIDNAVEYSKKYYAESFLGHKYLTSVYTTDYIMNNDSLTLFLSTDPESKKYLAWYDEIVEAGDVGKVPPKLESQVDEGFIIKDSYYGQVLVIQKQDNLLGLINFSPDYVEFISNWLKKLPLK